MNILACDFDGKPIPTNDPYISIQDVREHSGGLSYDVGSFLSFHDGLCAAAWLGKNAIGVQR